MIDTVLHAHFGKTAEKYVVQNIKKNNNNNNAKTDYARF